MSRETPRLKIRRGTDGSAWWNQSEHSIDSMQNQQHALALANGWDQEDIDQATAKELRRMTVSRKEEEK